MRDNVGGNAHGDGRNDVRISAYADIGRNAHGDAHSDTRRDVRSDAHGDARTDAHGEARASLRENAAAPSRFLNRRESRRRSLPFVALIVTIMALFMAMFIFYLFAAHATPMATAVIEQDVVAQDNSFSRPPSGVAAAIERDAFAQDNSFSTPLPGVTAAAPSNIENAQQNVLDRSQSSPSHTENARQAGSDRRQAASPELRAQQNASAASAQAIESSEIVPAANENLAHAQLETQRSPTAMSPTATPLRRALASVADEERFPETYRVFTASPDRVAAAVRDRLGALHAKIFYEEPPARLLCANAGPRGAYYCWIEDLGPRGAKLHLKLLTHNGDPAAPSPEQSAFAVQDFYTALAVDLAHAH